MLLSPITIAALSPFAMHKLWGGTIGLRVEFELNLTCLLFNLFFTLLPVSHHHSHNAL